MTLDTKTFPLYRIPTDIVHTITRRPGEWIQYGYQRIRFKGGLAEIQSMIVGVLANPFILRG